MTSQLDDLKDDELIEIFLKLPVKVVHRLKCVCKRWLSLLSDSSFARSYTIMHSNTQDQNDPTGISEFLIFSTHSSYGGILYSLPYHDDINTVSISSSSLLLFLAFIVPPVIYTRPPYIKSSVPSTWDEFREMVLVDTQLKGVCHDLLLVQAIYHSTTDDPYYKDPDFSNFYVCNPVTKHWVGLPMSPMVRVGHTGFTCYQLQESEAPGENKMSRIWANSAADKPKFIANYNHDRIEFTVMSMDTVFDGFIVYVFSSMPRGAGWRTFRVPFPEGCYAWPRDIITRVVFSNGMFHWNGVNCIAAYDPFNKPDHCDLIPLPPMDHPGPDSFSRLFIAATHEGCLRVGTEFYTRTGRIVVWELEDYSKKVWTLKYDVDISDQESTLRALRFRSFTGSSGDKAYLVSNNPLVIKFLDLRNGSLHCVHKTSRIDERNSEYSYYGNVEPFRLSPWPTSVPAIALSDETDGSRSYRAYIVYAARLREPK